jgi:hypothetical protein
MLDKQAHDALVIEIKRRAGITVGEKDRESLYRAFRLIEETKHCKYAFYRVTPSGLGASIMLPGELQNALSEYYEKMQPNETLAITKVMMTNEEFYKILYNETVGVDSLFCECGHEAG